jgi:phosphoribosylanthranilate isomerase
MVRVKVCGMRSAADIDICAAAGVDAVGFVFADGPRRLGIDEAAALTHHVPPFITSIGVFARNETAFIHETLLRCRLDVLQFSGDEAPGLCGSFGKPTIRVIHARPSLPPRTVTLPDEAALREARAVALALDSQAGALAGGTGVRVAVELASAASRMSPLPFILAGGLNPDNVADAIETVRPWGVDVRSGVERAGEKDRDLVYRFVHAAKGGLS